MEEKTRIGLMVKALPWIEQFLVGIPNLGKKTGHGYQQILLSFITFQEERSSIEFFPSEVKEETIIEWVKEIKNRYSLVTVSGCLLILARFLTFLENSGVLLDNPLGRLQKQYPGKGLAGIVLTLVDEPSHTSLEVFKAPTQFTSPLGRCMQEFLKLGRSQGKIYQNEEEILCRFDRFLSSYGQTTQQLSEPVIKEWLSLFPAAQSSNRYINFGIIRRFCLYLHRFDPSAYIPDSSLASPPKVYVPYIYSRSQIKALLNAALELQPSSLSPLRPQTYHLLISLLYTTGMRLGEALKLQLGDIDKENQTLCIRQTKFFKSRLVPLSPSMMKVLEDYLKQRDRCGLQAKSQSFLFQNPHRTSHYYQSSIRTTFWYLLKIIGLKPNQRPIGPRIHDIRHSMATHRLEDWYRQGDDVQTKLGLLSTYLGHVKIAGTQRYLTMTTELLEHASHRFSQYCQQTKEDKRNEG